MNTLQTRVVLGVIMFAAFFGVLSLDSIIGTDIEKNGFSPFRISGIVIGVWLFVVYWLSVRKNFSVDYHFIRQEIFVALIFWLLLIQAFTRGTKDAVKNISVTIFGILYIFFLLSFAVTLRYLPNGVCMLIMVLLVSKFGDIGGYLLGRKYGKHKLAKVISPNKTIEGACFSLLFSVLIAVIFSLIPAIRVFSLKWAIVFGIIVGFSALLGDLAESLLKRDSNVKDAGNLVPAFGGILDVIDCLLISMPVAYYSLKIFKFI
ncbi:MAG: phosphatidate cytidylyltransferase [Planctomycetes bacterium]|nr:phosphatidate cytidylyltransferase [Planctomycetota bacterium]